MITGLKTGGGCLSCPRSNMPPLVRTRPSKKGFSMSEFQRINSQRENFASIVRSAVLAPSSHNTQPWRFQIADRSISLYADRTRALAVNDPDDRELAISCGCSLLNLRVAAAHAGFSAKVEVLPDHNDGDLLARVNLEQAGASISSDAKLFAFIKGRRTYRKRFDSKPVPDSVMRALSDYATEERAWLVRVEPEEKRQEVAGLVAEGDAIQWADPGWRRELAAWMHPRRRGDGLTVPGFVAPVARIIVRTFGMGNRIGAKDIGLANASPLVAVLGTDGDDVVDWLNAGQALERVLLHARKHGLQASYLNQPIQVASLRPKLAQLLGVRGFPQILLRLGFPVDELPPSPRRSLDEVLESS